MVGAGAKILGAFEVGDNCSIAANAVLLKPLEDNVTAVGIPARPVKKDGVTIPKVKKSATIEEYKALKEQVQHMEAQIRRLEALLAEKEKGRDQPMIKRTLRCHRAEHHQAVPQRNLAALCQGASRHMR